MKYTMKIVVVSMAAIMLSGAASAATLKERGTSQKTCNGEDFTISHSDASSCAGHFANNGKKKEGGNDSNTDLNGLFGSDGWTEIVKLDASHGEATDNGLTLSVSVDDGSDNKSGNWSVTRWGTYKTVMAALKGGPTFAVYKLDTSAGKSGTWKTDGIREGNGDGIPGLSHLTLYTIDPLNDTNTPEPGEITNPDPSPVPLPAAGWLLLAGLGGLAAFRRRKPV